MKVAGNMTDNEIIKAIEYCSTDNIVHCEDCPFNEKCLNDENLFKYALDLINRQKADLEKNENIIRFADKTIATQEAEIERLNVLISKTNEHRGEVIHAITHIDEIKAEAYKEMADILTAKFIHIFRLEESNRRYLKRVVELTLEDMGVKNEKD